MKKDRVQRIVLVRPAVEAGERLGFLPGDLAQKVDPYLRPLHDALYEMLGFERAAKLTERNVIEVAPLAYMRGRTLNDAFVILDEAQKHDPGTDENVSDPYRFRGQGRDYRRHDPDRSAAEGDLGFAPCHRAAQGCRGCQPDIF